LMHRTKPKERSRRECLEKPLEICSFVKKIREPGLPAIHLGKREKGIWRIGGQWKGKSERHKLASQPKSQGECSPVGPAVVSIDAVQTARG